MQSQIISTFLTSTEPSSPRLRGTRLPIPVLLYHAVPRSHDADDSLSVDRSQFQAHLDAILSSGHTPMTVGEIAAGLRGVRPLPDHPMGITFDDANERTLDALEMLCEKGLRATVYVIAGEIDVGIGLKANHLADLAGSNQLELGAHSVNHPRLDELSKREVTDELTESKARLEEGAAAPIDTFAYPYGAYDDGVREEVIAAGFSSAAAVKNALSHSDDDPWAVARWTVGNTTSPEQIAGILDGRHRIPLAWERERLRTRGYRVVRKLRRRLAGAQR